MHASTSSGGGKRISQNEFTEKAWQAVVAAPDIAKQYQQQIVVRAACPSTDFQHVTAVVARLCQPLLFQARRPDCQCPMPCTHTWICWVPEL